MKSKYKVLFTPKAEKDLKTFRKRYWKSYLDFMKVLPALELDPQGIGKPLKGKLKGFYSVGFSRSPECRALYEIKNKEVVVLVVRIGTRENFYNIF